MAREKDDTEWAKDLRAEKMAGKGHIGVMGDDTWRRVERLTTHATTWIFGSRCRTERRLRLVTTATAMSILRRAIKLVLSDRESFFFVLTTF